jgi:hypothetical protein
MIGIRTCDEDMHSYQDFVWPGVGETAVAPDWDPLQICGYGLHFLLPGQNSPGDWYEDGRHLAIEVDPAQVVDLAGKSKAPKAVVRFVGTHAELHAWLQSNGHTGPWYRGAMHVNEHATAIVGADGFATGGSYSKAVAGDYGHAIAGHSGTAKVGSHGMAVAWDRGTAIAGARGTAITGEHGAAMAGIGGTIQIAYFDGRCKYRIGYIGEDGLEPNKLYVLDSRNNFVRRLNVHHLRGTSIV